MQTRSGAPGWNRTSDTRFREHETGVMDGSVTYVKVLQSPGFCATAVLAGGQAW